MFSPDDLSPSIAKEYRRILDLVGEDNLHASDLSLGIHDVLLAHFLVADFFSIEGEGIGGVGPKDINLLHSALYRQHVSLGGTPKWDSIFDVCATLMYGIIKDHVFYDANKRTAFLCALYFLQSKGYVPTVSEKEFEDFMVEIADDKLDKYARYESLRKTSGDPEVEFISHYLRTNTRKTDKRHYDITYRELRKILTRFHCYLENPDGNYIDVMKLVPKKKGVLKRREVYEPVRMARIGYPGETKQVSRKDIQHLRKHLSLTAEDGYDSQTFFFGVDPLAMLIAKYQVALRSLAER